MDYTVEQVDRVGEGLLALPAVEPSKRKLDKQAAIARLKDQIATVQQRGYTLEQIAQSMSGLGIQITTPTLKSYLQRARKPGSRRVAKTTRRLPSTPRREPGGPRMAEAERTTPPPPPKAAKPDATEGAAKSTRSEFIATDRERL